MARIIMYTPDISGTSYCPCFYTRLVLGFLGAVPLSFQYPYIPSRELLKSNFLYCLSICGLTLWSSYHFCSYLLIQMKSAQPYNHFLYIISFEMLTAQVMFVIMVISWTDTEALKAAIFAWYELIDRYEKAFKKPLPNRKTREWVSQTLIIISVPVSLILGLFLVDGRFQTPFQAKFFPSILLPGTIILSLAHHWAGLHFAVGAVSNDLSKHLQKVSSEHLLTPKILEDYKKLWLSLRNILDKINNMRIPVYVCSMQCVLATICIYESILLYFKSGDLPVAAYNVILSAFHLIPLMHYCRAGQHATNKVALLFEDTISYMKLVSVSTTIQKQLCHMYLVKRTRKPEVTLFGYYKLNLKFLLSTFSGIVMYIWIMMQFNQTVQRQWIK